MKRHLDEAKPEPITLGPFEEIVGRLVFVDGEGEFVDVVLTSGRLRYPYDSPAAEVCREELPGLEGDLVGILRLAHPEKPIIVRCLSN